MTNVKKLQLISLISGMYFYTPVMTLFLLEKDISVSLIVAAQLAFTIAMMAGELPTGIFADKFGQTAALRMGMALDALGMVQLLFVHNAFGLVLFFAVRGISVAFESGSDEALLYESHVSERGSPAGYQKSYGRFLSNDIVGFIFATAVSGIAVQFFGKSSFVPLIVITGLFTLVAFAITYTLTIKGHRAIDRKSLRIGKHVLESFSVIKKSRAIVALIIAGILTLNGEYFLRQSYQPFFEDMTVPALFLGVALALGKALNLLFMRYSHVLEKRFTVDQIILYLNLALGAAFVGLSFFTSPWILVAIFILMQGLFNLDKPIVSDYINQRIESHQRSTVLSFISLVKGFARIGSDLMFAGVVGLLGVASTYMVQGAYLVLGGLVAVWYLRRCDCVHKVRPDSSDIVELETMQEAK